jgi:hypothetical protein
MCIVVSALAINPATAFHGPEIGGELVMQSAP